MYICILNLAPGLWEKDVLRCGYLPPDRERGWAPSREGLRNLMVNESGGVRPLIIIFITRTGHSSINLLPFARYSIFISQLTCISVRMGLEGEIVRGTIDILVCVIQEFYGQR
jgi:hypothetical protein